ncbi:glycosyltransferase [Xenorhabdus bovienii]|uniref:glycosyltransferase n=1 Tax=Xenorhabdus bovienii TaxID=40576 RepID=UPI00237D0199|nr:glycosyltransferase [Xenorhabdus bovienii]
MTTSLYVGGAEKQVCDLADEFMSLGHQVTIISLTGTPQIFPQEKKINILSLNMNKNPIGFFVAYIKAYKYLIKSKYDVIHCHMFHANIFGRILRIFSGIPKLICTAHNTNEGGRIRMLAYQITNRLSDYNTNVSNEAVQEFINKKAMNPSQINYIPNGINIDKYKFSSNMRKKIRKNLNIKDNEHIFLAVGRLHAQKDYPNLITAFFNLKQENKYIKLFIIGDGPQKSELQLLSQSLGLNHEINFLGIRHDIPNILCACDTFVLSSEYEGFGLVVAESMLCERYTIATDCGGVRDVIDKYGNLIPPKNSEKLYIAMRESISIHEELKKKIGKQARNHIINNFSIKKISEKWINIYESL